MAKQTIDVGSSANKGDGDPLRTAFRKINENFDELYAGSFQDPEDTGSNLSPSTDNTYNLGSTSLRWSEAHIGDFLYLNGARIEVTAGGALLVNGGAPAEVQDTVGSVFGDDSTLLVDGVAGKIVGDIKNNLIETNNITALPGDTDLYIQGGINSGTPGNPARVNIGTTNTSTIVLGASDSLIYVNGNDDSIIGGGTGIFGTITGDLTGSVFGDDSTLLVDGVNGVIPTSVLQGDITNPIRTGNVVIESTQSPGSVTITHAGIGGITLDASTSTDGISLEGNVSVEGSFKPPMLTQVEIDALTPELGMMVYNTTTGKFQGYAADANNDSTTGWADLH